ncbi:hypothetical protein BDR07DRAFT_1375478 [Suillus spraguei]|nr:hypothetical protein BDR07DRAFT_1375478 [Suillus spraguei]
MYMYLVPLSPKGSRQILVLILAFGYGFLIAVAYFQYLAPCDPVCELMKNYPGELTMIVTLIATVLSVTASILFTLSVKEELRHQMRKPISLIHLSTGLFILTLFIFAMRRLLTAGWTTLLTLTYFMWPVQSNGSELDITGSAFATMLQEEFLANGLKGIVPTIESFSGSDGVPDANGTRLGFSEGNVTVNTRVVPRSHASAHIPRGFSTNYSISQQGLTANVSCRTIDSNHAVGPSFKFRSILNRATLDDWRT